MSTFDPAMFLEATLMDANSTVSIPVPAGEYIAILGDVKARQWQSKDDPTKQGVALDIIWEVDAGSLTPDGTTLKDYLGRDKIQVKQGIMLDLNEGGGIDTGKGKNVKLGKLREAVGCNVPGQPFSFSMMQGRPARVVVEHRVVGEEIFGEIKSVAKA